jgi:single-stranded DNA-specific DHH superfamily exonuclease
MIRVFTSLDMSVQDIIALMEDKQPLEIAFHSDADGVASVCLLRSVFKTREDDSFPYSPSIFGGYKEGNVAVDLGSPLHKDWKGICIDHHDHPDPWYPLVWSYIPTTLIVYYMLRDRIPKEKLFYVVLGCVGDGQPELIPDEVWDTMWDDLWERKGNVYTDRYSRNPKPYAYPLFSLISSPINALCRTGNVMNAYKLVRDARNIRDIVYSPVANLERDVIAQEESKIFSSRDPPVMEIIGNVVGILKIKSKYGITSRIASVLSRSSSYLTIVVINVLDNSISIRGILAKYLANKLQALGYHCGGHAGYAGGILLDGQKPEDLVEAIRKILR